MGYQDLSFGRRGIGRALLPSILITVALMPIRSASAITITKLIDNERFTVNRVTFAPGEKQEKLHPPPGAGQIATLVTPAELEVNLDDGTPKTEKGHMEPGKVWWLSKTTLHQFANNGTKPYDMIVVTFK